MKKSFLTFSAAIAVVAAFADVTDLVRGLTLVDENRAKITANAREYALDSYVVPFEQPYYIHIRALDGKPLELNEAQKIAAEYIAPRGCTSPLKRRADLDRYDQNDASQAVLGFEC